MNNVKPKTQLFHGFYIIRKHMIFVLTDVKPSNSQNKIQNIEFKIILLVFWDNEKPTSKWKNKINKKEAKLRRSHTLCVQLGLVYCKCILYNNNQMKIVFEKKTLNFVLPFPTLPIAKNKSLFLLAPFGFAQFGSSFGISEKRESSKRELE